MQIRNIFTSTALALALVANPALAQESAQIDATASLEPARATLTITGAQTLRFGRVAIPNRSRGDGASCSYVMDFQGPNREIIPRFVELPNNFFEPIGSISPAGCQFIDDQQGSGLFQIGCRPELPVDFVLTYRGHAIPGVQFVRGTNSLPFGFFEPGNSAPLIPILSASLTLDGGFANDVPCPAGGAIDLVVGGRLFVDGTAEPFDSLSVGTIAVAVNY